MENPSLRCIFLFGVLEFSQEGDTMLQDLSHGKLEIEYRNPKPAPDALALCFRGGDILLRRNRDDSLMLPRIWQVLS